MTIQEELYLALKNNANVITIVNDAIYPLFAKQISDNFIVYTLVNKLDKQALNIKSYNNLEDILFQVDNYSNNYSKAVELAQATKEAIYSLGNVANVREKSLYQKDIEKYRILIEFNILK